MESIQVCRSRFRKLVGVVFQCCFPVSASDFSLRRCRGDIEQCIEILGGCGVRFEIVRWSHARIVTSLDGSSLWVIWNLSIKAISEAVVDAWAKIEQALGS